MTPIYVVIALIGGGAIAAVALDRRRCRGAAEMPLSHPVMAGKMRAFREGEIRHHEDTPLTLAEEDAFKAIKDEEALRAEVAGGHLWAGDVFKARRDGEQA